MHNILSNMGKNIDVTLFTYDLKNNLFIKLVLHIYYVKILIYI